MFGEGIQLDTIYSSVNPEPRPTGQLIAANVLPSQARRVYKLLEVAATMQIIPVNGILQDLLKSIEGIVDMMYGQSESEVAAVSLVFMSWIKTNAEGSRDTNLVKSD